MFRLVVCCAVISAVFASTTIPPMTASVLYDVKHHKAMIVLDDGCYEYHMNHHDMLAIENVATRDVLEARMLSELEMAINIQETGHHHIDHMTQEIRQACAALPIYQWEIPQV